MSTSSQSVTFVLLQAVNISEASPAWQDYVDYIDAIVLDGLKQACLTSLKSMLNQIVRCNMAEVSEWCAQCHCMNLSYISALIKHVKQQCDYES